MSQTVIGADGKPRCQWCDATEEYTAYHDNEWGFPVVDDQRLFEKICLESFQSGLSWRTILSKRENFRKAFCHFDFNQVAQFKEDDIKQLLDNPGIVRHRGKIEAVINNAKRAQELVKETGSLAVYFWQFEPKEEITEPQTVSTTAESVAMSKDLKKRGWKFVGPTTAYAFMQAMGLVNDHATDCFLRQEIDQIRKSFQRPGR